MYCFIFKGQPKSFNAWKGFNGAKKDTYRTSIKSAFQDSYPAFSSTADIIKDDLYGVVYYFYRKETRTDADNLSKPLWDCLCNFLYEDDYQIKLRIGGIIDLAKFNITLLDFSRLPGEMITNLSDAMANEEHFLYIECGKLKEGMYKFNLESDDY